MLAAIGVDSVDELFEQIPEPLRLGRPLALPDGHERGRGLRAPARRSPRATPTPKTQVCFVGAGMYDHYVPAIVDAITSALRVPHPLHALPAGDLPGRPAGDVRVPDGDVGADRAAGLQRRPLRGPLLGRLGRLPGDRRDQAHAASSSPAACTRTAARRSRPTRSATAPRWSRSGSRTALTDAAALAAAVDGETAAVFLQSPNFLGAVEDVEALGAAAKEHGALLVVASTR